MATPYVYLESHLIDSLSPAALLAYASCRSFANKRKITRGVPQSHMAARVGMQYSHYRDGLAEARRAGALLSTKVARAGDVRWEHAFTADSQTFALIPLDVFKRAVLSLKNRRQDFRVLAKIYEYARKTGITWVSVSRLVEDLSFSGAANLCRSIRNLQDHGLLKRCREGCHGKIHFHVETESSAPLGDSSSLSQTGAEKPGLELSQTGGHLVVEEQAGSSGTTEEEQENPRADARDEPEEQVNKIVDLFPPMEQPDDPPRRQKPAVSRPTATDDRPTVSRHTPEQATTVFGLMELYADWLHHLRPLIYISQQDRKAIQGWFKRKIEVEGWTVDMCREAVVSFFRRRDIDDVLSSQGVHYVKLFGWAKHTAGVVTRTEADISDETRAAVARAIARARKEKEPV